VADALGRLHIWMLRPPLEENPNWNDVVIC
jgi:hypothetical protein